MFADLKTAAAHAGFSINDITEEGIVDELFGNAVLNGMPVQIKLAINT